MEDVVGCVKRPGGRRAAGLLALTGIPARGADELLQDVVLTLPLESERQVEKGDACSEERASHRIHQVFVERLRQTHNAQHAEQGERRHGESEDRTRVLRLEEH